MALVVGFGWSKPNRFLVYLLLEDAAMVGVSGTISVIFPDMLDHPDRSWPMTLPLFPRLVRLCPACGYQAPNDRKLYPFAKCEHTPQVDNVIASTIRQTEMDGFYTYVSVGKMSR